MKCINPSEPCLNCPRELLVLPMKDNNHSKKKNRQRCSSWCSKLNLSDALSCLVHADNIILMSLWLGWALLVYHIHVSLKLRTAEQRACYVPCHTRGVRMRAHACRACCGALAPLPAWS